MSERIDEGIIEGAVDYVTIRQTQTILMQMKESICKIKGKLKGTGFFCHINYENKNIPCLMTNFHVLDKEYIKKNNKIKISMNDNAINEEITIKEQDIIYQSKKEEYDLIIIKLNEGEEYIKNINYFELDEIYLIKIQKMDMNLYIFFIILMLKMQQFLMEMVLLMILNIPMTFNINATLHQVHQEDRY